MITIILLPNLLKPSNLIQIDRLLRTLPEIYAKTFIIAIFYWTPSPEISLPNKAPSKITREPRSPS